MHIDYFNSAKQNCLRAKILEVCQYFKHSKIYAMPHELKIFAEKFVGLEDEAWLWCLNGGKLFLYPDHRIACVIFILFPNSNQKITSLFLLFKITLS